MASLTLWTTLPNFRAYKPLVVAQYVGIKLNVPPFTMFKDNLSPEFLAKNPAGKIPVLETPNGCIAESNAIARYLARTNESAGMLGTSFHEAGQIESWLDYAQLTIEPTRFSWLLPVWGMLPFDQKNYELTKQDMVAQLGALERHLHTRTYLVGDQITLADVVVAVTLAELFRLVFDPAFRAGIPNVTRWFTTCIRQPQFEAVLGKFEFAVTEKFPDPAAPPAAAAPAPAAAAAAAPADNKQGGKGNKQDNKGGKKDKAKGKEKKEEEAPAEKKSNYSSDPMERAGQQKAHADSVLDSAATNLKEAASAAGGDPMALWHSLERTLTDISIATKELNDCAASLNSA